MTPEDYAAACERAAETVLIDVPIANRSNEDDKQLAATLHSLAAALRGATTIATQVDALTMRYELPPPVFDTTTLYGITLP